MSTIREILETKLTKPHQLNAALDDSPEILALACAGSGKTRTLAFRIARLVVEGIAAGTEPKAVAESIVAFTFTDKAAEAIKLQVATALGAVGMPDTVLGAMYIGTIHSYCQNVLGQMDARYRQFDVLDENRLKLYLVSRYPKLGLHKLRAEKSLALGKAKKKADYKVKYFEVMKQVSEAWKTMNDERILIADVAKHDPSLGAVLEMLRESLEHDQYIDFSLMIRLVVDALEARSEAALRAVSSLKHLIVDEYQDVNPAQEDLIRILHALPATLFVVGDDDQAIYAWRGADVSNILEFKKRYPKASLHTLPKNFRSTPAIVESADAFIAAELGPRRLTKNPVADPAKSPRDFRKLWFASRQDEAEWVADRIKGLLGTAYEEKDGTVRGLTPADFAILMRSTRQPEQDERARHIPFTEALKARDIPYSLEAGGGVFERPQVQVLRDAFHLLHDSNPRHEVVLNFFNSRVPSSFPDADFSRFRDVISDWGRRIHPPPQVRQRLFPQQLVHDLLEALGIQKTNFDAATMQDIGVFSRILQDVETVYLSVDSTGRFQEILHFLENVADSGYDSSTNDVLLRPDAVTVATVHKVKGLEFPVVFIADVEARRFPKDKSGYEGWLPTQVLGEALRRGAYQSTPQEEARLFYTAMTRAERFLYVSGSASLPKAARARKKSGFYLRLANAELSEDPQGLPGGLRPHPFARRTDETVVPTSFSEIRYFLRCPKDYQFRKSFGFSPAITEMFGFGKTVHTTVGKLHEVFRKNAPTEAQAGEVAEKTFHLKHAPESKDPVNKPGPFERAKAKAISIAKEYVKKFGSDFAHERAVEVRFEVPVTKAVISGAIDLLLKVDENDKIVEASVIDFKAIEAGPDAERNEDLHWTEMSLQVQLYAHAAREVLGENAKTGAVHMLKDNQRIDVPVSNEAIQAAIGNVEWSVEQIIQGAFPMRPHSAKCDACDFRALCPKTSNAFGEGTNPPPEIHVPGGKRAARAFSEFEP